MHSKLGRYLLVVFAVGMCAGMGPPMAAFQRQDELDRLLSARPDLSRQIVVRQIDPQRLEVVVKPHKVPVALMCILAFPVFFPIMAIEQLLRTCLIVGLPASSFMILGAATFAVDPFLAASVASGGAYATYRWTKDSCWFEPGTTTKVKLQVSKPDDFWKISVKKKPVWDVEKKDKNNNVVKTKPQAHVRTGCASKLTGCFHGFFKRRIFLSERRWDRIPIVGTRRCDLPGDVGKEQREWLANLINAWIQRDR